MSGLKEIFAKCSVALALLSVTAGCNTRYLTDEEFNAYFNNHNQMMECVNDQRLKKNRMYGQC